MPEACAHPLDLSRLRAAHLVGVGGAGMRSLSELLCGVGWTITGSDISLTERQQSEFRRRGVNAMAGHSTANVPVQADVLIFSPAVPADNSERLHARGAGVPEYSLHEFLGLLMAQHVGISITGTHGKSTTTALVGHLLTHAGLSPLVFCGAEAVEPVAELARLPTSVDQSIDRPNPCESSYFVVESCEYRRHFLHLQPRHAVLLNIEPDHFDCFPDLSAAIEAYAEFAARLPAEGTLVVNRDCPAAMQAAEASKAQRVTFGESDLPTGAGLSLPGRHNQLNAVAAVTLCRQLSVPEGTLPDGLRTFRGLKRRFEVASTWRGMTVVDDYAHHPTAVRATLRTAREVFPARRIWCVFQPHQVSRTIALLSEFAQSLAAADEVLLAPIFTAREEPPGRQDVLDQLAEGIAARRTPVRCRASLDRIIATLETEAHSDDVVIVMGAGDIANVVDRMIGRPPSEWSLVQG